MTTDLLDPPAIVPVADVLTDAGMKSRPRMSGLLKNQFFKAINEIPGAVKVKRGPHYRH